MNKDGQIKTLAVAIEEHENQINTLLAQLGNCEVQIAEYQQIIQELSDKLKLYENKYGTVFRRSSNTLDQR